MISILGVHGIGQLDEDYEKAEIVAGMSRIWQTAAAAGMGCEPSELDFSCAYYAPALAKAAKPQAGDALDLLSEDEVDMAMDWLAELGAPEAVAQGRSAWLLRNGVHWAQSIAPWLSEAAIAMFFAEVNAYVRNADRTQRRAARDEVAETIRSRRPKVIIAHSLGTVVTFEALWANPDLTADLLITLGSPLGMKAVRSRLEPSLEKCAGGRPPGVQRWVNVADPGDPIANPPHLKRTFPGIDSDFEDSIGLVSFHSVERYLGCAAVAATLAPLI